MRIFMTLAQLTILTILTVTSCKKLDVPAGTPSCIKKKIRKMENNEVRNPPGSVWQYNYNGETVYYIPSHCCDIPSELFDSKCNLICRPDGGITGAGDGQCPDFFSKLTNQKLIWQDDRQ